MIRRGLVAPVAATLRAAVRGALVLAGPVRAPGARDSGARPAPGAPGAAAAALLEAATEYPIYLLGWLAWGLDWIPRLPLLLLAVAARLPEAAIVARPVVLLDPGVDPGLPLERARRLGAEAEALLRPHGLALVVEDPVSVPRSEAPSLPRCGPRGLAARFFAWASARAPAPAVTVFLVGDLGDLAGCSFPGADWILADVRTDGTTLVHELGHLADLWRHTKDPGNAMTDRPGGSHDGLTRVQAAMIRSCRFARGRIVASARIRRGDPDRDGDRVLHGP